MPPTLPAISVGVATDVGRVRRHNEDSARTEGTVYVVADGMGGHAAGEVASRIAAETVVELADRPAVSVRDIVQDLINDAVAAMPEPQTPATTGRRRHA